MASQAAGATINLSPISRSKLAESVAQQLLEQIRTKGLAPGTRMPSERELMTALGVGRSTIREAMNGLALLGVVDVRHGQGAFVVNPDAGTAAPRGIALALSAGSLVTCSRPASSSRSTSPGSRLSAAPSRT